MNRPLLRGLTALGTALLFTVCPTRLVAQDDPNTAGPAEVINCGTPDSDGAGSYNVADQNWKILTIRPGFTVRSFDTHKVGIRIRLGIQLATYDLERLEDFDASTIRLGAITPGIELLIRTGSRSLLKPFLDVGFGEQLNGDETLFLLSTGLLTEFIFPWHGFEFGLEPGAQLTFTDAPGADEDQSLISVTAKADAHHDLPFTIATYPPEVGLYVSGAYLFDGYNLRVAPGETINIDQQYEIGFSLGFRDRPKVWIFSVPHFGLGYRFGSGVSGIRIWIGRDRNIRLPTYQGQAGSTPTPSTP